ncbi:hypothetical protein BGZ60DRAFT_438433 [Tricladium varicosporioides]|nr:hypothetical protein BGZ60DRAFT_438433 [Hymenoscyphus varicosporioides]
MLLEHGAWLNENFREIRDLAREKDDEEMQELLSRYDWREQYRQSLTYHEEEVKNEEGQLIRTSWRVLRAIFKKAIVLQTESGNWKGRKLVRIVKAALDAGAPPVILEYIRSAITPVEMVIEILKKKNDRQEEYRKAIADTPREYQYFEESDAEEIETLKLPTRHHACALYSHASSGQERAGPRTQREPRIRWSDLENASSRAICDRLNG